MRWLKLQQVAAQLPLQIGIELCLLDRAYQAADPNSFVTDPGNSVGVIPAFPPDASINIEYFASGVGLGHPRMMKSDNKPRIAENWRSRGARIGVSLIMDEIFEVVYQTIRAQNKLLHFSPGMLNDIQGIVPVAFIRVRYEG
jgi:hypothetical protein